MDITLLSDLHGFYPKLEGGDLLIVAGDLTARDTKMEYMAFHEWVRKQNYKKVILIAGNHDNLIQKGFFNIPNMPTDEWLGFEYLEDSGTEFEELKIYGSPWTKTFKGMNPNCKAFTVDTEEELAEKWKLIPDDTNILITHSPPECILDQNLQGFNCGSRSLLQRSTNLKSLNLFIWGHIHESYGVFEPKKLIKFSEDMKELIGPAKCKTFPYLVNASHVNERYQPVNKPVRVIL